ncbi:ABC transporter permease [Actinoalloteichus hymeniacidonis]|uniref:ABC-type spermidine/putrescine transport system, permease component II n=1 Tax=Actinoalloteichus hymeniacidonis TaxID=340345 RepID=A0AAC9HPE8_9PSEU|nr:ABC transporter permease [Actinoalloteichus hymeniacidonis]AOS62601.1 ABC-type spermidine/putrescine transport system, permease component II [Actinoalloteichus hymeniacidonis]MBB5909367.1 spermidine/putrescine transport system permease protein/putrescine transport system permease protein [Actinoalloteichus hymeniacidonis]
MSAPSARPAHRRTGRWPWRLGLAAAAVYVFLYAPILWLALVSFNDSRTVSTFTGFSLRWYGELVRDERVLSALLLSLRLAAVSAVLATVIGTLAAFGLRRAFRGRGLWTTLLALPLVVPEVVLGVSLLAFCVVLLGVPFGFGALLLAHVTFSLSYVVVVVRARLAGLDPRVEEAAADLGAGPFTRWRTVTLPLIAPAIGAGGAFAFVLSFDDVVTSGYLTGVGSTTLPVFVYGQARRGVSPEIVALSTAMVTASAVVLLIGVGVTVWRARRAGAASVLGSPS